MERTEQFLRKLSNQNKSQETLRVYRIGLQKYFSFLQANSCKETVESVERFLHSLESLSAATQKLYFVAIRTYYQWMKKYFILKVEYSFRKKIQNEERFYESEELQNILEYFEKQTVYRSSYSNIRNETYIKLAILTGARPSELLNLDIQDIRISDHHINIQFRNTKTKTDRIFPIAIKSEDPKMQQVVAANQVIKNLLISYFTVREEFMKRKRVHGDATFLSNKGNRLSYQQVRKMFQCAVSRMNLQGTPHYLRHTMITRKLIEGAPVNGVSRLVGHSNPNTTMKIYAHASAQLLEKISYNNLFRDSELTLI